MPSDLLELLCRLRRGDPGAAEDLADAARPELTRLARARVRDAALVDDVVQEALLEVLATHAALRDPAALRAWLRLIVRKQADRVTRRIRQTSPLNDVIDYVDSADRPERLVERRGDVATIRRGLAVVRDADALLLRLRYFGEWTDAELADLVGAAPGTVRKRIHAARGRLRAALDETAVHSHRPQQEATMPELEQLFGRIVTPADVPASDPITLSASGQRLETT